MMKETRIAGSGVAGRVSIRVEVRGTLAIWASISQFRKKPGSPACLAGASCAALDNPGLYKLMVSLLLEVPLFLDWHMQKGQTVRKFATIRGDTISWDVVAGP